MSSNLMSAPKEFLQLFKAGKDAARAGDRAKAHDYFRQAIEIDPYHEQVWIWLASVVETDEDRQVCFENVLELNPTNPIAHRQLQKLQDKRMEQLLHVQSDPARKRSRRRRLWRLMLVLWILAGIVAAVAAWGLI
jgi:ferric-dicitrate binding protein FerR (iron transport regulator)